MLNVLKHPAYAKLFSAQVIALLGTGLLSIALGLLAFDLAGENAGVVLGAVFTIKMVAYVGLSPIANAFAERMPRKAVLIWADLVRAGVALLLPFITATWQIYILIFLLQAASATFTPAFQATIPDILEDEEDYTNALSLSRLAYDLENLISPALAGLLLAFMSYHWLFGGTVLGFAISTLLVVMTAIPVVKKANADRPFKERLTRGISIYLATPRLRGLLGVNMAAAAISAFVLVNTVVIVRGVYGFDETYLAYALAAYGGGSMLAALTLPKLLLRYRDRTIMLTAAVALAITAFTIAMGFGLADMPVWLAFIAAWAVMGALYSFCLTPSGRLLRRSAHAADRPSIFTAHFAMSHLCWLITYPLAGWGGAVLGLPATLAILVAIALLAALVATRVWPANPSHELEHVHPDLPADHPHLKKHGGRHHAHEFVIDDEHKSWPTHG
ncbi:MAG: MFS transporter [Hyphomicrobiales bacterium]